MLTDDCTLGADGFGDIGVRLDFISAPFGEIILERSGVGRGNQGKKSKEGLERDHHGVGGVRYVQTSVNVLCGGMSVIASSWSWIVNK